jgi:hypothetical protein
MGYYNYNNVTPVNYQQQYVPQYTPQYSQYLQSVQQPQQLNNRVDFSGVIVNSFDEVRDYPVPLGGLTLLLNNKDKKFYLKKLNETGVPMIETYSFQSATQDSEPVQEVNINDLNRRVETLEKIIDTNKDNSKLDF